MDKEGFKRGVERVTRREFLRLSTLTAAGAVVSSCSPAGIPQEISREAVLIENQPTSTPPKRSIPITFSPTPRGTLIESTPSPAVFLTETLPPTASSALKPTETAVPTATFTKTSASVETSVPTKTPTETPIPLPTLAFEITPYPEPPTEDKWEDKWIEVDLSEQYLVAYEGSVPVWVTKVSTGKQFPTKVGQFRIYSKLDTGKMSGPGYNIPDVPWIMYYSSEDAGYGIHGAYWHDNFGQPMSHGCVNLSVEKAKWLYRWVPDLKKGEEGVLVFIHE